MGFPCFFSLVIIHREIEIKGDTDGLKMRTGSHGEKAQGKGTGEGHRGRVQGNGREVMHNGIGERIPFSVCGRKRGGQTIRFSMFPEG